MKPGRKPGAKKESKLQSEASRISQRGNIYMETSDKSDENHLHSLPSLMSKLNGGKSQGE